MRKTPLAHIKTYPYLTAEPEITTLEVKLGDFGVMASHGLWNGLINEGSSGCSYCGSREV